MKTKIFYGVSAFILLFAFINLMLDKHTEYRLYILGLFGKEWSYLLIALLVIMFFVMEIYFVKGSKLWDIWKMIDIALLFCAMLFVLLILRFIAAFDLDDIRSKYFFTSPDGKHSVMICEVAGFPDDGYSDVYSFINPFLVKFDDRISYNDENRPYGDYIIYWTEDGADVRLEESVYGRNDE